MVTGDGHGKCAIISSRRYCTHSAIPTGSALVRNDFTLISRETSFLDVLPILIWASFVVKLVMEITVQKTVTCFFHTHAFL